MVICGCWSNCFWSYWINIIKSILILFENVTTTNERDYYLLKETTEAAMFDAVDVAYYRATGELKISQEAFVEAFARRYAENTSFNMGNYTLEFYDIIESPPKVSVIITTGVGTYNINGDISDYNVANRLDAILEYKE